MKTVKQKQISHEYHPYSVLMSVYHGEAPQNFRESIASILQQSIQPHEIVIVKDGGLTAGLEAVLEEFRSEEKIKIVALESNKGLGEALNEGLKHCAH